MGQVSLTLPADGTTIEAADVNNPFNTLLNEFNGNIDDNNIKTGANINAAKLLANSLPPTILDANSRAGWLTSILSAPNTITALGNRSYQLVFNTTDITGYISAGMRLRTTRTTAAPNQCTSLNGSSQYYNKTSPAGMTFTDDFAASAWVKLSSYATGDIISRYNGTSGWRFVVLNTGQIELLGYNAASGNESHVVSNQSIPLNKWVHVAAQLDMSAFTATTITSYTMIDGLDVPATVGRAGTNPTALIQAGDLQVGASNGASSFFPGKIAQAAVYNAKVTQATILASMNQTLSGSETALISAYSFNNTINDLNTTNANNLTAQASAVATSADSPFGAQADGTISTTLDYAIVTKTSFSTNTTLTVQVPEGCTIPTSGGLSALAYSEQRTPYQMPSQRTKWRIETWWYNDLTTVGPTQNVWINAYQITAPLGEWNAEYWINMNGGGVSNSSIQATLSTGNSTESDTRFTGEINQTTSTNAFRGNISRNNDLSVTAAANYYLNYRTRAVGAANIGPTASISPAVIRLEPAFL
jgi:hypothetical protein